MVGLGVLLSRYLDGEISNFDISISTVNITQISFSSKTSNRYSRRIEVKCLRTDKALPQRFEVFQEGVTSINAANVCQSKLSQIREMLKHSLLQNKQQ